ncbi:MAG: hypothetical protein ACD_63C00222G0001 [uncultured bacterium]|nr:MAG: hypothetical protein ACD_63C00222G0001 [uncultured bacterium]
MQDKHNYKKAIEEFPDQITQALELAKDAKVHGDFDSACICGMGASAFARDLITTYASNTNPIWVAREYNLPREITDKTLILASSYSGNTEETLSCFNEAKERGLKIIGFSKNGKLEELCDKHNIPLVKYPNIGEDYQPRWAFGYSFGAMTKALMNCKVIPNTEEELQKLPEKLENLDFEKQAKDAAKKIFKKIPLVFGPQKLKYVARIWQVNFNESAKIPAYWNYFPEVNHFELTGYTQKLCDMIAIMLRDKEDIPRISERMDITAKLLAEKGIETVFIDLPKGELLVRMFGGILLSMWTSYFLAEKYGVDPAPTEMVEKLKKMLS